MSAPLAWFDSHCHFDFSQFDDCRDVEWLLAQRSGVEGLLIPGVSQEQGQQLIDFCLGAPNWHYALGLHPYWNQQHSTHDLNWLDQALAQYAPVALGEFGMDRLLIKQQHSDWAAQWQWFLQQLELAEAHKLPLILHIRGAHDEVAAELKRRRFPYGGLVHAFSGSEQQGRRWCDLGFCLGVGGAISYPNAKRLRKTFSSLPIEHLLLETDSPDMAPAFFAHRQNTPAAIPLYGAILASITGYQLEKIAEQMSMNLKRVFDL